MRPDEMIAMEMKRETAKMHLEALEKVTALASFMERTEREGKDHDKRIDSALATAEERLKKPTEYVIVSAMNKDTLTSEVIRLMRDGWTCQGGAFASRAFHSPQSASTPNGMYFVNQAMTR